MSTLHPSNPTGQVRPKGERKYLYHIPGLIAPLAQSPTPQFVRLVAHAAEHMERNSYKACPDCGIDFRFHSISKAEKAYQLSSLYYSLSYAADEHNNTSDACSFYWDDLTDDV